MRKRIAQKLKERKGFTLIEMIIVIAIIAILIALIAPNLQKFLKTAKQTKADAGAKTLYTSASTYLVEKYTKGESVDTSVAWTEAKSADGFLEEYFNENEMSKNAKFTIKFDADGNVESVEYSDGDKNIIGNYPKKTTTTGDGTGGTGGSTT